MTQQADWIKAREAIRARLEANYPATDSTREHRNDHEAHQQWPEETAECNECEEEYEAEIFKRSQQMRADVRRLLAKSEEDEREKESLKATAEQWFNEAQAERQHKDAAKATLALREQRISELEAEKARALKMLDLDGLYGDLEDACAQRMQAYITEQGNVETLERELAVPRKANEEVWEQAAKIAVEMRNDWRGKQEAINDDDGFADENVHAWDICITSASKIITAIRRAGQSREDEANEKLRTDG